LAGLVRRLSGGGSWRAGLDGEAAGTADFGMRTRDVSLWQRRTARKTDLARRVRRCGPAKGTGMAEFDDRVVIVTGAARGQGLATARRFLDAGARAILTDVLDEQGEAAAAALGSAADYVHLDVTSETDWSDLVRFLRDRFGRADVLVNNAGITFSAPLVECPPENFRRVIDVNLVGAYLGMRAIAPLMGETGGGSIVNVSSVQGLLARKGVAAYTASKFGLRGLTKAAALELGELGVRVNSIHPGGVATEFISQAAGGIEISDEQLDAAHAYLPVPRAARSDDIAPVTLFLASDAAAYITGAELAIDGGMSAGIFR